MKNYDIMAVLKAFNSVNGELKLPAAVAWKRRLNHHKLLEAGGVIEEALSEVRTKYSSDEYSVDGEEVGERMVKPQFVSDFTKEQAEIMNQETEIEIRKVKIEDLGDIEISDKDMDTLAFMIEE